MLISFFCLELIPLFLTFLGLCVFLGRLPSLDCTVPGERCLSSPLSLRPPRPTAQASLFVLGALRICGCTTAHRGPSGGCWVAPGRAVVWGGARRWRPGRLPVLQAGLRGHGCGVLLFAVVPGGWRCKTRTIAARRSVSGPHPRGPPRRLGCQVCGSCSQEHPGFVLKRAGGRR